MSVAKVRRGALMKKRVCNCSKMYVNVRFDFVHLRSMRAMLSYYTFHEEISPRRALVCDAYYIYKANLVIQRDGRRAVVVVYTLLSFRHFVTLRM